MKKFQIQLPLTERQKKERQILNKYWFFKPWLPLTESAITFGFEVEDGWISLIEELCEKIDTLINTQYPQMKTAEFPFDVCQVKSKFGGLRFYVNGATKEIEDLIDEYEEKSYHICEKCGKKAKTYTIKGWAWTLCKKCRIKKSK